MDMEMTETSAPGGRARWSWLASLGFLFIALGPLLMLLGAIAFRLDLGEGVAFLAPPIVLGGLMAYFTRRFGTWSKIVGIVIGLLALFGFWWTVFGLFSPNSFFDFVPGLLVPPGIILAIAGSIAALVAKKRGNLRTAPDGNERAGIRMAAGAAVVLGLVSGLLTLFGRSTVADPTAAEATARMKNFKFVPNEYTVAGGSQILVRNSDPFLHTFTIDELGIDVTLTAGSEKLITIPAKPGTYVLYCEPHGNPEDYEKTPTDENNMAAGFTVA